MYMYYTIKYFFLIFKKWYPLRKIYLPSSYVFHQSVNQRACKMPPYLCSEWNLSQIRIFHFVWWASVWAFRRQSYCWRPEVVARRKSRARSELDESEANEPKAKRFQLAKWWFRIWLTHTKALAVSVCVCA